MCGNFRGSNIGQPVFAVEVDASVIDISNEKKEINISPVLTFDEMVREVAKENGIPIIQAQQELDSQMKVQDKHVQQEQHTEHYRNLSQSMLVIDPRCAFIARPVKVEILGLSKESYELK